MRLAALLLALASAARADLFVDYSRAGTRADFSERRVWIRDNPPAIRVEYPFDPATKRAGTRLSVDGETYLIDRATKRAFILPSSYEPARFVYPEAGEPFNQIAFGQEVEFFRSDAAWQGEDSFEDSPCDFYKQESETGGKASLWVRSGTDRPLKLTVARGRALATFLFRKYASQPLNPDFFNAPKTAVRVADLKEALDLLAEIGRAHV